MTPEELFTDIDAFCQANADEANVQKYSRYFKTGFDAYGVSFEKTKDKIKILFEDPAITLDLIRQTGPLLVKSGKYEETVFAVLLLKPFSKQFTKETYKELGHWFDIGINNWAHTDFICSDLMKIFFDKGLIKMNDLSKWREAKNKFKRRAVPVSLIKELKKSTDYQPVLDFIEPLMMDPEREVHQGLGWLLREAWKKQPAQVEPFLLKWKNQAPRLIFQYATEKMTPSQKELYRKEKPAKL